MSGAYGGDGPVGTLAGRSRGTAAPAAPGGQAVFTIAHGLGAVPSFISVLPRNLLSSALFFATADATNITVTFALAPLVGSLGFYWSAEL